MLKRSGWLGCASGKTGLEVLTTYERRRQLTLSTYNLSQSRPLLGNGDLIVET